VSGLFKSVDSTFVPHIGGELDAGRLGLIICDHMTQDTMGLQKWQLRYKYSTTVFDGPVTYLILEDDSSVLRTF
jgi:hypothetical protein